MTAAIWWTLQTLSTPDHCSPWPLALCLVSLHHWDPPETKGTLGQGIVNTSLYLKQGTDKVNLLQYHLVISKTWWVESTNHLVTSEARYVQSITVTFGYI